MSIVSYHIHVTGFVCLEFLSSLGIVNCRITCKSHVLDTLTRHLPCLNCVHRENGYRTADFPRNWHFSLAVINLIVGLSLAAKPVQCGGYYAASLEADRRPSR